MSTEITEQLKGVFGNKLNLIYITESKFSKWKSSDFRDGSLSLSSSSLKCYVVGARKSPKFCVIQCPDLGIKYEFYFKNNSKFFKYPSKIQSLGVDRLAAIKGAGNEVRGYVYIPFSERVLAIKISKEKDDTNELCSSIKKAFKKQEKFISSRFDDLLERICIKHVENTGDDKFENHCNTYVKNNRGRSIVEEITGRIGAKKAVNVEFDFKGDLFSKSIARRTDFGVEFIVEEQVFQNGSYGVQLKQGCCCGLVTDLHNEIGVIELKQWEGDALLGSWFEYDTASQLNHALTKHKISDIYEVENLETLRSTDGEFEYEVKIYFN